MVGREEKSRRASCGRGVVWCGGEWKVVVAVRRREGLGL